MTERPILFSTPMVQALLEGNKTMTRRIIDPQPESGKYPQSELDGFYWKNKFYLPKYGRKDISLVDNSKFGQPGDVLWVRETARICNDGIYAFKADYPEEILKNQLNKGIWKPSIFMPKAAARIWLQVEEIRVERLQDISEEDMISEGVQIPTSERNTPCFVLGHDNSAFSFLPDGCLADGATPPTQKQIRFAFWAELWCKINGRESWDSNPWVWVVKFKTLSTIGKPQMCYKTNEICKYDCKGLCRESM